MYNSGMTAAHLFSILREDVDIALSVGDGLCVLWLNAVQQMLYSEIVREQRVTVLEGEGDAVRYSSLAHSDEEDFPSARDIVGVFADGAEAQRVSGGIGRILHGERPAWYDGGAAICLMLPDKPETVEIAHVVRPALITEETADEAEVMVPPEFIPMVLARLRGEMYKVANEDGLAAKWLADYNTELETFKVWAASHGKHYGM